MRLIGRPNPLVLLAVSAVAGCATTGQPRHAGGSAENRMDVDSYVLLAEIALEEQRQEEATEHYLSAALASTSPTYAERATRMAHTLSLNEIGHRAVARWQQLAPNDERAEYFEGIFEFRSGRLDEAVTAFANVLDTLSEAELPSGIALVLEALGAEPTAQAATNVMGRIIELATGFPGYDAHIPPENGMLPEALVPAGYAAYAVGKWHLTPDEETHLAAPRDRWPLGRTWRPAIPAFAGMTNFLNHTGPPPANRRRGRRTA